MTPPARGTRPANRRELVLAAAAELFHGRGYSNVSMKDIADAVAMGPSALYRHFRNKNDLLEAVVSDGLTTLEKMLAVATEDPSIDPVATLATTQLEHRAIGVLWRREARHLTDTAQRNLRHQIRRITALLGTAVQHDRPELDPVRADFLAWSMVGVATSVSFHTADVPAELLTRLVRAVAAAPIPALSPGELSSDGENSWAPSRREAILAAAIRLFATRGYADVSLEDIGTAVGIAGASVYNHFDSKADILILAMERGNEILRADMHRALARASGADDAVRRLITAYSDFARENGDLIRLLNSETDQLPPDDRHRIRKIQHDYIAEWMQLVRQIDPGRDDTEARIRVQAALNTINDIATTPHLCDVDGVGPAIDAVCGRLL
ncbi:putative transcriptional regulator, TetR family [Nocardia nova SH22a]|uniref:Putative transcriptional regulator, TetR family n=1 Tax=Nocardia nova SH22a TaxID=1415166 RepID=W5TI06_9NOCA|nr:TetR/AcrR family transcriptional regulator [Nocardia nova]AHH18638.1 putative transcriptional regulator, TetR family [Nocardia nova SH22a]